MILIILLLKKNLSSNAEHHILKYTKVLELLHASMHYFLKVFYR